MTDKQARQEPGIIDTIALTDNLNALVVFSPKYGIDRYVVVFVNSKDEIVGEREFMSEHGAKTGVWDYFTKYLKAKNKKTKAGGGK